MESMTDVVRLTPIVLAVAGLALLVIAAAAGSNEPHAGLAIAAAAAIVDGLLTISDRVGTATNILTFVIVAGVVVAVLGRGIRT